MTDTKIEIIRIVFIVSIYLLGAYLSIFEMLVPGVFVVVEMFQGIDVETSAVVWGIVKIIACGLPFFIAHVINIFALTYRPL